MKVSELSPLSVGVAAAEGLLELVKESPDVSATTSGLLLCLTPKQSSFPECGTSLARNPWKICVPKSPTKPPESYLQRIVSVMLMALNRAKPTGKGGLKRPGVFNLPLLVEVSSVASLFTRAVLRIELSPCPELIKGTRLGRDLTKLPIPIKTVPSRAWTLRTSSRRKTLGDWPASGDLVATKRRNSLQGSARSHSMVHLRMGELCSESSENLFQGVTSRDSGSGVGA